MNKLLSMELKRTMKSPILWIGIMIVVALNVYGIMLNMYGFAIHTTTFLFMNSARICIILAILIPLHIGHDFEARTINNKISAGYSRKQIYLTEVIVSAACGMILFLMDIASVFVCSAMMHLEFSDEITYAAFIINAVISLICIVTISALFTMLAILARKQLLSLGIAVLLTISMLTLGGNTVSALRQSEYNMDAQSGETVENILYIRGFERTAANAHLLISPFAQVEYESPMLVEPEFKEANSLILKNFPYHIEFCIFNLLELILFCRVGIHIFRRQDLK
ncbi:MAG: ABC transporter permease subunit [Clostridiales bacterium]|nr:ABC transporter permease subunit [Clostridiales bacterium]